MSRIHSANPSSVTKVERFLASSKFWWLLVIAGVITRLPTILFPYDSDHWIFYYIGKNWLNGGELYINAWDHKSPLIFFINGSIQKVVGDSLVAHRIVLSIVFIIVSYLFYQAAKSVFSYLKKDALVIRARAALMIFVIWASLSQLTNNGNNTEFFALIPLLLLYWQYTWSRQSSESSPIANSIVSGFLMEVIVALKANFAIILLPIIIDISVAHFRKKTSLITRFGAIGFGAMLAFAPWLTYFWRENTLHELFVATYEFNSLYLKSGWAGNLSGQLVFVVILLVTFLFFIPFGYRALRSKNVFEHGIILSTVLFMILLGTFYSHYYLILVPGLALIVGLYWQQTLRSKIIRIFAITCLVLTFGISYKQLYNTFYGDVAYQSDLAEQAADYVEASTSPNDTIFFYGYGATFYRLADRQSGSRYISASHLLIDWREGFGYDFNGTFMRDMEANKTKLVIIPESTADLYDDNTPIMQYFSYHYAESKRLEGYTIYERIQ